jgi:hypothetical protein
MSTYAMDEPMRTVTTAHRGEHALVTPFVAPVKSWGGGGNGPRSAGLPLRTTTTSKGGEHAVIAPVITKFNTARRDIRSTSRCTPSPPAIRTITLPAARPSA